jgi:protein-disulfide isomerase
MYSEKSMRFVLTFAVCVLLAASTVSAGDSPLQAPGLKGPMQKGGAAAQKGLSPSQKGMSAAQKGMKPLQKPGQKMGGPLQKPYQKPHQK